MGRHLTLEEVVRLMDQARAGGVVGRARKTRLVDARPARAGAVVVTRIAGEGEETRSRPAATGDWVVRNRCPETGNEEYLVSAKTFAERYALHDGDPGPEGWREAVPRGKVVRYFVLGHAQGEFEFDAPWGEPMRARPGDAIVQDPDVPDDIYRVASASFRSSYEILD